MKEEITKDFLATLRPQVKPYEVRDTKLTGLLVRVQPASKRYPNGSMTYVCQYGRGKRTSIGSIKVVTLAQARDRTRNILAHVRLEGTDPIIERRKAKTKAHTLEGFLNAEYAPYLDAHHSSGTASMKRLKRHFIEPFGKLKLHEITAGSVEKWRDWRLDNEGKAVATVNRDINLLKAALSKAVKWGLLSENPLASVKPLQVDKAPRVRYLTDAEECRLRAALDAREAHIRQERASANKWRIERGYELLPALDRGYVDHLKPMVLLLLNTGCRRGEVFNLKWSDIDLDRAMLTVEGAGAKTGQTRHINLNDEALDTLKTWKEQSAGNDLVFPGRDGGRMNNIKTAWRRLLKNAEITGFRLHDLRHTFASNLVMADVNLRTVQELLGHTDPKLTTRYAHLSSEIKSQAVQKLGQGRRLHLVEIDNDMVVSKN